MNYSGVASFWWTALMWKQWNSPLFPHASCSPHWFSAKFWVNRKPAGQMQVIDSAGSKSFQPTKTANKEQLHGRYSMPILVRSQHQHFQNLGEFNIASLAVGGLPLMCSITSEYVRQLAKLICAAIPSEIHCTFWINPISLLQSCDHAPTHRRVSHVDMRKFCLHTFILCYRNLPG